MSNFTVLCKLPKSNVICCIGDFTAESADDAIYKAIQEDGHLFLTQDMIDALYVKI